MIMKQSSPDAPAVDCSRPNPAHCGPLPGTVLRIFIPPGAVINFLNLVEFNSPSGICLIIRIPLLGGGSTNLQPIISAIRAAGGTVESVR